MNKTNMVRMWQDGFWVMPNKTLMPDFKYSNYGFGGMAVFSECRSFNDRVFLLLGSLDF